MAERNRLEKMQSGTSGRVNIRRKLKAVIRKKKAVLRPVALVLAVTIIILGAVFYMQLSFQPSPFICIPYISSNP